MELTTDGVKVNVPAALSRVSELISTSAGEFTRVGTFPSKGPESAGNT
jgi:hypothetical protein